LETAWTTNRPIGHSLAVLTPCEHTFFKETLKGFPKTLKGFPKTLTFLLNSLTLSEGVSLFKNPHVTRGFKKPSFNN